MFPFSGASQKSGWMAILPQGESVTLAHVLCSAGARPELRLLDNFTLENGVGDALQRLRASRGLRRYACTTLMGEGEYNLSQLDAPNVPKSERKEALRWALKDMVSFPLESACIDVLDVPNEGLPPGRAASVLVVSAAESAVRARLAPFEAAKVELAAIDIPELAQRNVAALFEDENRGLALLRIDESGMMLTLTFRGELIAVRRSELTTTQLNVGDAEQQSRVRERLVLELQRSLDNFDRQYSHMPISKVVLACHPAVDGLSAALAENVYVPVRELDLAAVIDFPSIPELRNPQCQSKNLLAIGAALRSGVTA